MASQRFESRFCRFDAPGDWRPLGELGVIEDRPRPPRSGAVVSEVFLDPPGQLAEYAARQREAYLLVNDGAQVVHDAAVRLERFAQAHLTGYRVPIREGFLLVHQLHVAHGPLVCSLTTTAPEGDADAEGVSGEIAASFEVTAAAWAVTIRRARLHGPGATASAGAVALPHLQLSLAPPPGWTLDVEAGTLRRGDAHLALRRPGAAAGGADRPCAEALARIQRETGWLITSWDCGELGRRREYWALEAVQETRPTWGPPRRTMRRTVFVNLGGVLELDLLAGAADTEAPDALGAVLQSLAPLPAADRKVPLRRSWLPESLAGPWQEEGPGLFVRSGKPGLSVFLAELPGSTSLEALAAGAAAALASEEAGHAVTRKVVAEGLWQRHEAVRLALDSRSPDGAASVVRAAFVKAGEEVLVLLVRGEDAAETERTFVRLLEGVRPDMAPGGLAR